MKFNKWTLALAAVGAVSLTSVAQAEEQMMVGSQAAAGLTSTTISGYVDTSAHWNIGRQTGAQPSPSFGGASKADGFNFNVAQVSLAKALDESEWASGYRADLWFGPDAVTLGSQASGDVAIRQAYVALRTPVGNGIDWKMGVFDTIVGYETLESGNNPNYTRSFGFGLEPTTHTGLLGTYRFSDSVSVSGGLANTYGAQINQRTPATGGGEDSKTIMGSVALTAPSDWGWVAGSSLYLGGIHGYDATTDALTGSDGTRDHYYAGLTLATPVAGMKVGAAFDYSHAKHVQTAAVDNTYVYALYASFQATEKLSLHGRAEYQRQQDGGVAGQPADRTEATLTAQYDLWKNVISRAEIRWDHSENNDFGLNDGNAKNTYLAALNLIYKF